MKIIKKIICQMMYCMLFLSSFQMLHAQSIGAPSLLSAEAAAAVYVEKIAIDGKDYSSLNDTEFYSIAYHSGAPLEIVYAPKNNTRSMALSGDVNWNSPAYIKAKSNILMLLDNPKDAYDPVLLESDLGPVFIANLESPELILKIRNHVNVKECNIVGLTPYADEDGGGNRDNWGKGDGIEENKENGRPEDNNILAFVISAIAELGFNGCEEIIENDPDVEYESDGGARPWNYDHCRIEVANELVSGNNVKIALLDTGLSQDQGLFTESGWSSSSNREIDRLETMELNGKGFDDCGHGTRMAGILGGPKVGKSVRGVAYDSDLLSIKSHYDVLIMMSGEVLGVMRALRKIRKEKPGYENVDIISMSAGTFVKHPLMHLEVKRIVKDDILFFAAIGTSKDASDNYGVDLLKSQIYPAKFEETIGCTGVFANKKKEYYPTTELNHYYNCHYGPAVDFVVPMALAGQIISSFSLAMKGDEIVECGGSSVATATMAGIAALVKERFPNLSAEQIKQRLIDSASHGRNRTQNYGYGVVNAALAVGIEYDDSPGFSVEVNGPDHLEFGNEVFTSKVTPSGNYAYQWSVTPTEGSSIVVNDPCPKTNPNLQCIYSFDSNANGSMDVRCTVTDKNTGKKATAMRTVKLNENIE